MSLADYHKEFEILAKVAHEAGADFVTMERARKRVYPITAAGHLTDRQKGVIHKKDQGTIHGHYICNELKSKQIWLVQGRL